MSYTDIAQNIVIILLSIHALWHTHPLYWGRR